MIGIFSRLLHFTHFCLEFYNLHFESMQLSAQIGKLLGVFSDHHGVTDHHLQSLAEYRLQGVFLEYRNCFHIKIFSPKDPYQE